MTQKELVKLALDFSLYLNPKVAKKDIMRIVDDVNGPNKLNVKKEWVLFTQRYNEIKKMRDRDKKLSKLGI